MTRLQPLKNYVLIKEQEKSEITDSGIVIPEGFDMEPPTQGTVVETGSMCDVVKKDDLVMFHRYGFEEIEIDKEKYLIGEEENIFGKIC